MRTRIALISLAVPALLAAPTFALWLAAPAYGARAAASLAVAVTPGEQAVTAGDAAEFAISVTRRRIADPVKLTVLGLPAGATGRLTLGGAAGRFTLRVETSPRMVASTTTATVVATAGSIRATAGVRLTVRARPAPTPVTLPAPTTSALPPTTPATTTTPAAPRPLSMRLDPATVTLGPGESTSVLVTLFRNSGDAFPAQVQVLGLPPDVTATVSPNPTTASASVTLRAAAQPTPGTILAIVNATGGGSSASSNLGITIGGSAAQPGGFTVIARANVNTILPGQTASYTVEARNSAGLAIPGITVELGALPAGFTGALTSALSTEVTVSLTSPLTVTTGTYDMPIIVRSGTAVRSTFLPVDVQAFPGFGLAAQPESRTIARGASGTFRVSVLRRGGFSAPVTVAASGFPTGVTASVAADADGATVTVAVGAVAATGAFTITLTATSGGFVASVQVGLSIT